jgi:hypothetical protein
MFLAAGAHICQQKPAATLQSFATILVNSKD